LHRRDVPLRERANDRAADASVQRRGVEYQARRGGLEKRRRTVLRTKLLLLVGTEKPRVPVHREHVVVARQKPQAGGHSPHWLVLAQRTVERIGVGVELRRQMREIEARGNLTGARRRELPGLENRSHAMSPAGIRRQSSARLPWEKLKTLTG